MKKLNLFLTIISLSGCIYQTDPSLMIPTSTSQNIQYGYTYHRSDGNRWVEGKGKDNFKTLSIPLKQSSKWIIGSHRPNSSNSIWIVVDAHHTVRAYEVNQQNYKKVELESEWSSEAPPAVKVTSNTIELLEGNAVNHGIPLTTTARAFINEEGNLCIHEGRKTEALSSTSPLDSRLLLDKTHLLFLTQPTTGYSHGVLGDKVEATGVKLMQVQPTINEKNGFEISIPEPDVIEGVSPLWGDLDGDGIKEIVVTLSNTMTGSRLVVYNHQGQKIAESDAIGTGFRWRHQLAIAPLGPDGEIELVSVKTPHIGGIVEYFILKDNQLKLVAEKSGYSTHVIGSRNLDMALSGDFNGDGKMDLMIPNQSRNSLALLQRTKVGVAELQNFELNGILQSNLTAININGSIQFGAATDKELKIWY